MLDLVFLIFSIELLAHLLNVIGASRINGLAWTLVNYLPVSTSRAAAQQRQLQAEYLKVRRDLNGTSSQDEFAKWAKLRRQHDKLLEKLEASKKELEASRAKFDNSLWIVRLLLTKVPQYFVPFWYGKQPMFWLPYGWFPYYAEWIISFPSAPMGSVSAPSWQLACTGFISLVSDLVVMAATMLSPASKTKQDAGKTQKAEMETTTTLPSPQRQPQAVPTDTTSKKEL
ncbi:hypothetical protein L249_0389 [Ophiocordyceps polyrhachis-furcata BCC 54312]|uniref:Uncharacterized protein n=1 Tax=Ophiocordyceps polyrhachis-furcata BCC 54312 TaxID=1330021 RepID=A0A367LCJ4_9HYPO|nr:hypothetical protein L249_0389 [Ophiocordyceps polyrhachis-furcata BCC 54312]